MLFSLYPVQTFLFFFLALQCCIFRLPICEIFQILGMATASIITVRRLLISLWRHPRLFRGSSSQVLRKYVGSVFRHLWRLHKTTAVGVAVWNSLRIAFGNHSLAPSKSTMWMFHHWTANILEDNLECVEWLAVPLPIGQHVSKLISYIRESQLAKL